MDVLASYSIFQELQLVHDTGYFSALPSLEENWQQTCLELERYLQTEPKKISETFGEELDCFLNASLAQGMDSSFRRLDPILIPLEISTCERRPSADILLSQDKLLSETCLSLKPTGSSAESYTTVNQAQLNAVTSLTPPSSPELGRHLVKTSQTLSALDGTVTLKLVTKKASLSPLKTVEATVAAADSPTKCGQNSSEQVGTTMEASLENKKRIHRCQFNGCRKVYTKSSHLKAHQRTHTVKIQYSEGQSLLKVTRIISLIDYKQIFSWFIHVRSHTSAHGKGVSGVLHEVMSLPGTTGSTQVQNRSNATTATGVFPGLITSPST
uniref:Krueppel-like factor 7 isoform X1 n=1 Tax=Geotrypetes seraphini TaxID=260995 RepID=A0A6P8QYU6_GEOSA|nr:Krueppel-like factor 7 isoform X1 [Geotrypetes seraphini]